jgi:hypothetical protein
LSFGDFERTVQAFAAKVAARERAVHNGVCDLAFSSIVEGSPVTGAPGQPVDTGFLKGSWQNLIDGPLTRRIVTNVAYAPVIEYGVRQAYDYSGDPRPLGYGGGRPSIKSTVGGQHSVALTRAGWQRIVDVVTTEVARG